MATYQATTGARIYHFHEGANSERIWLLWGRVPTEFDADPSPEAIEKLRLVKPAIGKRYRDTVRCPVNGDGYWYYRRELLDQDGQFVGSIVVPGSGGEL